MWLLPIPLEYGGPAGSSALFAAACAGRITSQTPRTNKPILVDSELTMFLRTDGGWQKADEPALRMFDARNPDAPVPELQKTFPQTGEFTD